MSHTQISPPPRNTPPPVLDLVAFKRTLAVGQVWRLLPFCPLEFLRVWRDEYGNAATIIKYAHIEIAHITQKRVTIIVTDYLLHPSDTSCVQHLTPRRRFITLDALRFMLQNHELISNE